MTSTEMRPVREPLRPRHYSRRRGQIVIDRDALHSMLGVPEGMVIVGIYSDPVRPSVQVVVEGDGLAECTPDVEPPILCGAWSQVSLRDEDGRRYFRFEWVAAR